MDFNKFIEHVLLTLRGDVMAASGLLNWWRTTLPLDGEIPEGGPITCNKCKTKVFTGDWRILDGYSVCKNCMIIATDEGKMVPSKIRRRLDLEQAIKAGWTFTLSGRNGFQRPFGCTVHGPNYECISESGYTLEDAIHNALMEIPKEVQNAL